LIAVVGIEAQLVAMVYQQQLRSWLLVSHTQDGPSHQQRRFENRASIFLLLNFYFG